MTTIAVALMFAVVMVFTGSADATTIADNNVGTFEMLMVTVTYPDGGPTYTFTAGDPEPIVLIPPTGEGAPYIGLEHSPEVAAVPEPGTALLMLSALVAGAVLLRRASRPSDPSELPRAGV